MRLDRFPRDRRLLEKRFSRQTLLIVAAVVAVHVVAASWWTLRTPDRGLEIREYVTYIDITPDPGAAPAPTPAPAPAAPKAGEAPAGENPR